MVRSTFDSNSKADNRGEKGGWDTLGQNRLTHYNNLDKSLKLKIHEPNTFFAMAQGPLFSTK